MAVTDIAGPGGSCTIANITFHISEWNATENITEVETTGFVDNGNHTAVPTKVRLTGSASGTGQSAAASTDPFLLNGATPDFTKVVGSIVLTAFTGCIYTFNAVYTSIALSRPNDGKLSVTFNFGSTGAITKTGWSTT